MLLKFWTNCSSKTPSFSVLFFLCLHSFIAFSIFKHLNCVHPFVLIILHTDKGLMSVYFSKSLNIWVPGFAPFEHVRSSVTHHSLALLLFNVFLNQVSYTLMSLNRDFDPVLCWMLFAYKTSRPFIILDNSFFFASRKLWLP